MNIEVRKPTAAETKAASSWGDWSKEPSTFPMIYDQTETCYILAGRATVKSADQTVTFGAGDWVVFPKGLDCTWEIQKTIKKKYQFS
jgi:uncharacterized protein